MEEEVQLKFAKLVIASTLKGTGIEFQMIMINVSDSVKSIR